MLVLTSNEMSSLLLEWDVSSCRTQMKIFILQFMWIDQQTKNLIFQWFTPITKIYFNFSSDYYPRKNIRPNKVTYVAREKYPHAQHAKGERRWKRKSDLGDKSPLESVMFLLSDYTWSMLNTRGSCVMKLWRQLFLNFFGMYWVAL